MALNERQRRFADEYPVDCNATQAAIRAGYSKKTAYSQGQRLLKNVEVQERVKDRLEELEEERVAKGDEVLKFLTKVMRGEESENHVDKDGVVTPFVSQRNQLKAAELLAKCHSLMVQKVEHQGPIAVTFVDDLPEDDGG